MTITRNELKQLFMLISSEYPKFVDIQNKAMLTMKLNLWYEAVENYETEVITQAVKKMLMSKLYGEPKISDLIEIIKPPKKERNEGIEFANRILELQQRHGTEKMKDYVHKEFGEVGLKVYIQLKEELRHLQIDDIQTFKAQTRSLYNSYYEREMNSVRLQIEETRKEMIGWNS